MIARFDGCQGNIVKPPTQRPRDAITGPHTKKHSAVMEPLPSELLLHIAYYIRRGSSDLVSGHSN